MKKQRDVCIVMCSMNVLQQRKQPLEGNKIGKHGPLASLCVDFSRGLYLDIAFLVVSVRLLFPLLSWGLHYSFPVSVSVISPWVGLFICLCCSLYYISRYTHSSPLLHPPLSSFLHFHANFPAGVGCDASKKGFTSSFSLFVMRVSLSFSPPLLFVCLSVCLSLYMCNTYR